MSNRVKNRPNWKIQDQDNICFLTLDVAGKDQNVLTTRVIEELDIALDHADVKNSRGLVIRSGKQSGFIAGADISEFARIDSPQKVTELTRFAGSVLLRIESLPIPTVAAINGHCLGGGLELALACDYRIVEDRPGARLGLPEVKLGIHPGFGGTIRLIELVGAPVAMDLILGGRTVSPHTAQKLGIVDYSVPARQLQTTVNFMIDKRPPCRRAGLAMRLLDYAPGRWMLSKLLEHRLEKKISRNHYPAPFSVIEFWRKQGGDRNEMFRAEQDSISMLFNSATAKNLVRVFHLQEALKSPGKRNNRKFRHVHVIGAGTMGGDIASWCAMKDLKVTIHDQNPDALARATRRAQALFRSRLKSRRLVERAMDRFSADTSGTGACKADMIIEAVVEDAAVKQSVFTELEKTARPDAVLATNTSSIDLETISASMKKPGRLAGLHFFNPVAKMPLVEIVYGDNTFKKTRQLATAFSVQIGRLPVAVKSGPGFLVNRVLMPYTLEAVILLGEGYAAADIDRAATSFGMPMGPLEMADTVGLDICLDVAENLGHAYNFEIPKRLGNHVAKGNLGEKTGNGFYKWKNGNPVDDSTTSSTENGRVQQRLMFRYFNECVACIDEKVVSNHDDLDAALIFSTGFAPFRGGPVNYILDQGVEQMLMTVRDLQREFGDRFAPCSGWSTLVN